MKQHEDDLVHEAFLNIAKSVITQIVNQKKTDHVTVALLAFLVRVMNTYTSIFTLKRHSLDETLFAVDAGALLRCMFDAYLQADFIYKDEAERMNRATMYVEFAHVERFKMSRGVLKHNNHTARKLHASPNKSDGEIRNQVEYDRVKGMFPTGTKNQDQGRTRNKWYAENLPKLAEEAGRTDEYDSFSTPFSGCVHSSFFAVTKGPIVSGDTLAVHALALASRVLLLNIGHNDIAIGEEDQAILDLSEDSLLG